MGACSTKERKQGKGILKDNSTKRRKNSSEDEEDEEEGDTDQEKTSSPVKNDQKRPVEGQLSHKDTLKSSLNHTPTIFRVETPMFGQMKANQIIDILLDKKQLREIKAKTTLTDYLLHFNLTAHPDALREIIHQFIEKAKENVFQERKEDTDTVNTTAPKHINEITKDLEARITFCLSPNSQNIDAQVVALEFLDYLTDLYDPKSNKPPKQSELLDQFQQYLDHFKVVYDEVRVFSFEGIDTPSKGNQQSEDELSEEELENKLKPNRTQSKSSKYRKIKKKILGPLQEHSGQNKLNVLSGDAEHIAVGMNDSEDIPEESLELDRLNVSRNLVPRFDQDKFVHTMRSNSNLR